MLVSCWIKIFTLKLMHIFNKFHFYVEPSIEISEKGLLNSKQQTSSLMGHPINHRMNMFLSYKTNCHHESEYEYICKVINGKMCSVPLNSFSSVFVHITTCQFYSLFTHVLYLFQLLVYNTNICMVPDLSYSVCPEVCTTNGLLPIHTCVVFISATGI